MFVPEAATQAHPVVCPVHGHKPCKAHTPGRLPSCRPSGRIEKGKGVKPMRKPRALCAGLAIAAFSFVASEAAEVRIGDFVFGCKTSDGQVRKPQFGDMNGVFYTDIRGQEKACKDAVKRMIANCHQHTRFLRPADNRKYPECLPVFQEQANECAAFFRQEIAKCSGDGGGTGSAAKTHGVFTIPEGQPIPGWRYEGPMRDGKPHGRGVLTNPRNGSKGEAKFHDGILHGRLVVFHADGGKVTMEFRDGKRQRGVTVFPDGYRSCYRYENDRKVSESC